MTIWFRRLDVFMFIATECSILPFFGNIFECPFCPFVISYQDVLMIQIQHVSAGTPRAWWHWNCQEETTEIRQLLWAGEVNSRHVVEMRAGREETSWYWSRASLTVSLPKRSQSFRSCLKKPSPVVTRNPSEWVVVEDCCSLWMFLCC